jgi:hypothetical protein
LKYSFLELVCQNTELRPKKLEYPTIIPPSIIPIGKIYPPPIDIKVKYSPSVKSTPPF